MIRRRPHMLAAAAAIAAMAFGLLADGPALAKPAAVVTSPLPSVYDSSATFSLKANGRNVPVIAFSSQYDYAVFSLANDGTCELEISRLDRKPIATHAISPMKYDLAGKAAGAKLTFAIDKPVYLIVAIDDLRKLVIAVDPPERDRPAASGPSVYNVAAAPYKADRRGADSSTAAIQRAVDDAGKDASKAGVVYVPNGVYRLAELRLVSNVTLYLEPGAVLRLSDTRDELKLRYKKNSQNRHGTWFIHTQGGATNVKILGRGTIDGDGKRIEKDLNLTSHVVVPMNCTGFTLDGPVLRDSGLWGVVVANSRNVRLANTKHFNHLDMGENDCVDVCNSQDVTVERSIGISLDDPYSTKTWDESVDVAKQWTGEFQANRNIVFDDCLSWTRCFAFKIGAGVWRDQENITVKNSVVYDSAHAIGISHSYGSADVRNATFDGIDVERNTMTNLGRSWARFVIDKRKPDGGQGGRVYGVHVRNVTVRDAGTDPVTVVGLADDKRIQGVTFERIVMPGKSEAALTLAEAGVTETRFAQGVVIVGASIGSDSARDALRGTGASPVQPAAPAAGLKSGLGRQRTGEAPVPREIHHSSDAQRPRTRVGPRGEATAEGSISFPERAQ